MIYKGTPVAVNEEGIWARPLDEFLSKVKVNGEEVDRFTEVNNMEKEEGEESHPFKWIFEKEDVKEEEVVTHQQLALLLRKVCFSHIHKQPPPPLLEVTLEHHISGDTAVKVLLHSWIDSKVPYFDHGLSWFCALLMLAVPGTSLFVVRPSRRQACLLTSRIIGDLNTLLKSVVRFEYDARSTYSVEFEDTVHVKFSNGTTSKCIAVSSGVCLTRGISANVIFLDSLEGLSVQFIQEMVYPLLTKPNTLVVGISRL